MRILGQFLTLWTALLFYPLSSFALGLGEIDVSSFLNQPLKAEIEVISARPGEVDDLLVSLASREAFRKAGLERPADLSKLRFKVEKSEDGLSAKILISTQAPVKEPFLNFLVEADWAKGRLLREFTVLLDPPYFSQQASTPAPTVAAEQPTASEFQEYTPSPIADSSPAAYETESESTEPLSQPIALSENTAADESLPYVDDGEYLQAEVSSDEIVVNKGDTLWGIASQFKDEAHSMAQVMLAMQVMNPDAFAQDNINNLKVGAVLRAPDRDTLDRLSKQQAYVQVLEQNGLWDDYVAQKTGAVTSGSPLATDAGETSGQEPDEGQLTLLTPDDGDSGSASLQDDANSQDAGQIRKQLALAEEELEASKLENRDLQSRIADLEQQISKFEELQKLVQIEDDSLAQLQQDQATQDSIEQADSVQTDEGMTDIVEGQPTDVMIEAAEDIMSEQPDDQMVDTTPITEVVDEMTEAPGEETVVEEMAEDGMQQMEVIPGDDQTAEQEQDTVTVPAPVIVTEAPVTSMDGGVLDMLPSLDTLLADPIMLGGIGAILALLIGFLFLKRKKAGAEGSETALDDSKSILDEDETPIHIPTAEDAEPPVTDDKESLEDAGIVDTEQHMADTLALQAEADEEDEMNKTAVLSAEEMPSLEEPASVEQDDVLNEVDVYLAYGLYDNAEELLKDSLENNPDRADYRAKLLDTYFATKNADGFVKEAEAMKSLGGGASRFWSRVQIMGYELAPENELFADAKDSDISVADLEYAKPDSADFDIGGEEDITDFSNTDFDLSADSETFDLGNADLGLSDDEFPDTQTFAPSAGDDFSETQALDDVALPSLDDEDSEATRLREGVNEADDVELPDEIGDFDLDLEAGSEELDEEEIVDEDALNFDLPEDLDLSAAADDDSLIPLDPTVEAPDLKEVPPMDETDAVVLDFDTSEDIEADEIDIEMVDEEPGDIEIEDDTAEFDKTVALSKDSEGTVSMSALEKAEQEVDEEGTKHIESALDMDMSDLETADLKTGDFQAPAEDRADDITEFKPAEFTGEFTAFDPESDTAVEEIDTDAGLERTGTFAPGDFNDEELDEALASLDETDDIEGLMLPDDVDEVSTKLDLAKAFIDMGDAEGAKTSLEEVLSEGTQEQKAEATGLLNKIN